LSGYDQDMTIELTFGDLTKLATDRKLDKDGTTFVINRPVLTEITIDSQAKSGKVVFFLDETDPHH